jgi:hypothetical protein
MDREHSRQVEHDKLVQAGVALGFWQDHENLFMWAPIPRFVRRADYRCLELARC